MPPRALLYARVSTAGQADDGGSLESQEAACRAYCAEKGYPVEAVFQDVHTGSEWRERPGLTALRDRLEQRGEWVIVANSLDRVSRNQTHLAVIVELFEYAGARLELVTESFEDSATGRFIRNAKAFAAEVFIERNKEQTIRGMLRYMHSGKRVPGRVPAYGLRWLDERKQGAEEDPATAPIVRRVFQLAADGATLLEIARTLTDEGIPSPTGRPRWQSSSVAFLLRNPLYQGDVYARRWIVGRKRGKWFKKERPASERIPLPDWPIEPLIDAATWDAAQRTLQRNRLTRRVASAPDAFLLRGGFVVCGACGHPLAVQRGRRYDYYRCQAGQTHPERCDEAVYVRSAELDTFVWEGDNKTWPGVPAIVEIVARRQAWKPDRPKQRDTSERELRRLSGEIAALRRALARTEDPAVTDTLLTDLSARLAQERTLRTQRPPPAPTQIDAAALREHLDAATTYGGRRRLLAVLSVQARVWRHPSGRRGRRPRYEVESILGHT